jgi:glycosyltransferase involved in cell wall biosynthesis
VNVSIVIPAYNEAENLRPLIVACHTELDKIHGEHEILVVNDGSTDSTGELLDELAASDPILRPVHHPPGENVGSSPAWLKGFSLASGEAMIFLPADLQILPSVLPTFLEAAQSADVVTSHRVKRADPPARRWLAAANNRIERWVLGIENRDSHSSMLITRRAADTVLPQIGSNSAVIHSELVVRASRAGLRVVEVEIEHHPRAAGRQTGAKPSEVLKVLYDLARLRRQLAREARSGPSVPA